MVNGFVILSGILVVILFVSLLYLRKHKTELSHSLKVAYILGMLSVLLNAVSVFVSDQTIAALTYGLYLASNNWLTIAVLVFSQYYADKVNKKNSIKIIISAIAGIDSISLIVNNWTHHMFEMKWTRVAEGEYCYSATSFTVIYYLHLLFVYIIGAMILSIFVYKIFNTVSVYRRKYSTLLIGLASVFLANSLYKILHFPLDITSITYFVVVLIISYFTFIYVPTGMLVNGLANAVRGLDDSIICFDVDGECLYYNTAFEKYFGLINSQEDTSTFYKEWIGEKDVTGLQKTVWRDEKTIDGQEYILETSFSPMYGKKNEYIGCYFVTKDITTSVNKLKSERFRAFHDPLTGSLNRLGFFEEVRNLIDRAPDIKRYMVVSDIRNFKLVNELFGTNRGDSILIRTAELMKKYLAPDSVFGRLSADKFAVCVPIEEFDIGVMNCIIGELANMAKNSVYKMHIHLGIYEIKDVAMDVSLMCDKAIMAIEKNKDNYEMTVCYYDDAMTAELQNQNILINEFEGALADGQFKMFLQPQISTVEHKLLGGEALVRWIHPERGMISPGEFIPLFERTGYIYRLDKYIWEQACIQLKKWKERGVKDLYISVNISPKDFYYIDIYTTFTELVEKYDISPDELKLEITETAIITNACKMLQVLEQLRSYGFSIAIDDFGSGYSSLNTLKDMKVDELKLDKGFLGETMYSNRGKIILNSVVAMSKELSMVTVTEGVETKEQIQYLTGVGCDILQGFYFSKPIPVDEFEEKYNIL
ncbi:MAG: EAL domain-containing protein [Lachnospiraceae bacterium]|nr:EAL domain-containing protein [Lachnospiraceae bacterium]